MVTVPSGASGTPSDSEVLSLLNKAVPGLSDTIRLRIAHAVSKKQHGMCRLATLLADALRSRELDE